MKTENRRNRMDLFSPAELAIYNAQVEVEKIGADVRLTNAGILLQQARYLVADFIDGVDQSSPTPTESKDEVLREQFAKIVNWLYPTYSKYWGSDTPNCNKWYERGTMPDRNYYTTEELYDRYLASLNSIKNEG
jgi:hypothetical protein